MVHRYLLSIPSPPAFVSEHQETISFFVGYTLQIATQHLLHAIMVYGLHTINTREKYFKTLVGQYGAYLTAMVGSTILNTWLRNQGMGKDKAFVATMFLFSIINYFVIGWIVRQAAGAAQNDSVTHPDIKSS